MQLGYFEYSGSYPKHNWDVISTLEDFEHSAGVQCSVGVIRMHVEGIS